uniref:NADH-ubiquinone oxidoreductase chain 6 n=1 Tax=Silvanidae sp. KM-2017 TaxID=2219447 RepID=A0A346RHE1_9CUCU|nr:NADH dehydrogenase subunit 6 [Silvanidae sp. KM-2017]
MSSIIMITPLIIIFMKHPISMGMMILTQTMIISMNSNLKLSNPWLPYILFMIMVGGLMVLFMYMTSVASNEKFKFSAKTTTMASIMVMITIMMWSPNKILPSQTLKLNEPLFLTKFITPPNNNMFILMIIYLLITLVATIKIMGINSSPLRQKF